MPFEAGVTRLVKDGALGVPEASALEDLNTLQRELRHLLRDQLQIAALEVRLAAHNLMAMIAAAVCIGVLLLLAWAGLMAATGLSLMEMGLKPVFTLLVLATLTISLAVLLGMYIRHKSRRMGLPATMRALKPAEPRANPGTKK